jgi:hypothetical protein
LLAFGVYGYALKPNNVAKKMSAIVCKEQTP